MARAVGIDLGTTYTAVAVVDEYGKPVVLKNADGGTITPSAVYFDPPHYVVGETALQSTISDPERVAQFVKRFMGTPGYRVPIGERSYSPEFVSALILKKVVSDASAELGETIERAVITVPAYFTESQRQATFEAGRMAGLQVLRIIAEPTAAALSYGLATRRRAVSGVPTSRRRVLVYDLGGGTFDVTVLEIDGDELTVLAVGGDARLGGKDFDDRIMSWVEERLREDHGLQIEGDATLEAELRLKATAAKRQLSGRESVPISLKVSDEQGRTTPIRIELSREQFEELGADLLQRTEMLLGAVLKNAHLSWRDISETLCVGGSSRMPMVGEMLERVSGRRPMLHDPDECVAKGAAIQAAILDSQRHVEREDGALMPAVSVGHVLAHSLGVAVMCDGQAQIDHVIPALTRLPVTQVRHGYTTTNDHQEFVQIRVYEGESRDPQSYGKGPIGVFELPTSNPPRPAGAPNISVAFRCDENGSIMAAARDRDTGQETRLTITLNHRRDSAEMSEEAQLLQNADIS